MDMFDNYENLDPNYIPNNEHKFIPCRHNNIVSGGSNQLVFELPLFYKEGLLSTAIIFNQEERLIFIKAPSEIVEGKCFLLIKCDLSPEESIEFGRTNLDTLVQLKLEYADKTLYTEVEKINVLDTLKFVEN